MSEDRDLRSAARRSQSRETQGAQNPEPSLARRFGQIGVLGWMIVAPTLLGVVLGHWLDRMLGTGIMLAAALILLGAALGLWFALKWMHEQ